jgi:carnitine 3-dehydrogenase
MGPHLIYQLGGGEKGVRGIIDHIGPSIETWWDDMAALNKENEEYPKIFLKHTTS